MKGTNQRNGLLGELIPFVNEMNRVGNNDNTVLKTVYIHLFIYAEITLNMWTITQHGNMHYPNVECFLEIYLQPGNLKIPSTVDSTKTIVTTKFVEHDKKIILLEWRW